MSQGRFVDVRADGAVFHVRIDRGERHNALVPELVSGLRYAVAQAAASDARAVVLTAAGANFSTGGDVAEFAGRRGPDRAAYARSLVGDLHDLLLAMIDLPVPVVTACQGLCTGGSLGLLLASDVVVLGHDARLQPWYVEVGFSPDGGWSALLPDLIGRSRSLHLQLTNGTLDAEEAVARGVAAEVSAEPAARAAAVAGDIATMRPGAVRCTKALHRRDRDRLAARLAAETESFVRHITTDEATAGMSDFLRRTGAPS